VDTADDVLSVLWQGAQNRAISATDMNEHSSRSHTIFSVSVEQSPYASDGGEGHDEDGPIKVTIRSKVGWLVPCFQRYLPCLVSSVFCASCQINLVDLAGSEKLRPHQMSGITEKRLAELTAINQSLSCLGNCIRALGDTDRTHIPFRDSKLTRLLQDSLGGNTKVLPQCVGLVLSDVSTCAACCADSFYRHTVPVRRRGRGKHFHTAIRRSCQEGGYPRHCE
jgi:kinesin family member 3B